MFAHDAPHPARAGANASDPQPQDRIAIIATVTGFAPDDPARHNEWFRMGRAVAKWWDPITLKLKPTKGTDADKLACQIAFAARFDRETLEVETARYFYDDASESDPFNEESESPRYRLRSSRTLAFFSFQQAGLGTG
jgi:putative ATP-dependent endonuclease of the OLD family